MADFLRVARLPAAAAAPRPYDESGPSEWLMPMVRFAESVRCAAQSISKTSTALKIQSGEGYLTEPIIHKLCLAQVYVNSNGRQLDWVRDGVDDLRKLFAGKHLEMLPAGWPAQQISSFACRPDWPMLASMYRCLWKEVAYEAAKQRCHRRALRLR